MISSVQVQPMKTFVVIVTVVYMMFGEFLTGSPSFASGGQLDRYRLALEFPVLDMPYNVGEDAGFPSMGQSLYLTKNFYQLSHAWIMDLCDGRPEWQTVLSVALFDALSAWVPLGDSWLHEEWHRAVMTRRGIHGYNEVYEFNVFDETIAVSHVKDEDLIRLKSDHPADMVRLHVAGMEAQYELNLAFEKDRFFLGARTYDDIMLWVNYLNTIMYIAMCASDYGDEVTDDILADEGRDISDRDFTGLDFTAYVYDLFRPEAPYTDRGVHPSGTGVNRYIRYEDLSSAERDYLRKQRNLSLLNLVDPFLFGKNRFHGRKFDWNLTLRHHLTPFGYALTTNWFLMTYRLRMLVKCHAYVSRDRTWPGMEVELIRRPMSWLGKPCQVSLRTGIWMQPETLAFREHSAEPGGMAALTVYMPLSKHMEAFVEVQGKTKGWVAGTVYLDENVGSVVGFVVK